MPELDSSDSLQSIAGRMSAQLPEAEAPKLVVVAPSDTTGRSTASRGKPGILIICVDRDNDVGLKTGLETPIVGRGACLDAAMKLALADPEEADANTIFAAVKEYEELVSKGINCEVAAVGGLFERGVLSDKKIRNEVEEILRDYPAVESVIVSDGVEGEELTPVISTLVPVVSIRKVIIKHSKSVEESYEVLGRYFRMLLFDKRYSRYALGIPGLIFVGFAIAYNFSQKLAPLILIALIGIIFTIRGFNVDREVASIKSLSASGYLRLFAVLISVFIVLAGIVNGIYPFFNPKDAAVYSLVHPAPSISNVPAILGSFISNAQLLVWLGLGVYVAGALFFNLLSPQQRHVMRNVVALIVLGLLYIPVDSLGGLLLNPSQNAPQEFTAYALFSLAVSFVIAAYVYNRVSKKGDRSEEAEEIES